MENIMFGTFTATQRAQKIDYKRLNILMSCLSHIYACDNNLRVKLWFLMRKNKLNE